MPQLCKTAWLRQTCLDLGSRLKMGKPQTQDDSLAETPKDLSSDTAIEPEHISSETPRSFVFRGELFIYAANW